MVTVPFDLSVGDGHAYKTRFANSIDTNDRDIAFSNYPPTGTARLAGWLIIIEQDAMGGIRANWPAEVVNPPTINIAPNTFSVTRFQTIDGGLTVFAFPEYNPSASGTFLPANVNISNFGTGWTNNVTIDLDVWDGHVFKYTVNKNLTHASAVLNIPPVDVQRTFEVEYVHDGTANTYTILLPNNFVDEKGNTLTSFDISSGTILLSCRVNDGSTILVQTKNVVSATALVETFTWTNNHSANGFDLLAVKNIDFDGVSSTIEGLHNLQFAQTSQSINSLAGQVAYQGAALDKHSFVLGGAEVAKFDEAAAGVYSLDMLAHKIKNSREHTFDNTTEAIITNTEAVIGYSPTTEAAMLYNVPSGKSHIKKVNDVDIMTLSATNLTFVDGLQIICNPDSVNAGINVGLAVGDPSSTNPGDLWYNQTLNKFRTNENGADVDVVGSGANTALSNLIATSVNQSLNPDGTLPEIWESILRIVGGICG